jgi:hypothetical protein
MIRSDLGKNSCFANLLFGFQIRIVTSDIYSYFIPLKSANPDKKSGLRLSGQTMADD